MMAFFLKNVFTFLHKNIVGTKRNKPQEGNSCEYTQCTVLEKLVLLIPNLYRAMHLKIQNN